MQAFYNMHVHMPGKHPEREPNPDLEESQESVSN